MIKHGTPNPLNTHNLRIAEHNYEHFTPVYFEIRVAESAIINWVYENLEGRFWLGDYYYTDTYGFGMKKCISFENPGEASYFAMFLDTINTITNR
jgi:hypothetical protein